jgi:hypothetical protein
MDRVFIVLRETINSKQSKTRSRYLQLFNRVSLDMKMNNKGSPSTAPSRKSSYSSVTMIHNFQIHGFIKDLEKQFFQMQQALHDELFFYGSKGKSSEQKNRVWRCIPINLELASGCFFCCYGESRYKINTAGCEGARMEQPRLDRVSLHNCW